MPLQTLERSFQTIEIARQEQIAAPIEVVFETILEQIGPGQELMDGHPMPMKLEAWPGGRWFRDLGEGIGHLWGHVQVIKPPKLLEISGPMFMSYPGLSHIQYRLTPDGGGTRLDFSHRAMGLIPEDDRKGVSQGWGHMLERIRKTAEKAGK